MAMGDGRAHGWSVRGGGRAGAAGLRRSRSRPRLDTLPRFIGARGLHRVVLHAGRHPVVCGQPSLALSPGADRSRARGRGDRGAANPVSCQLAAPAVLRMAVFPLPEAKPGHRRPRRIVWRDADAAAGRAPRAWRLRRSGHLRAPGTSGAASTAGGSQAGAAVSAIRGGLRPGRLRGTRAARTAASRGQAGRVLRRLPGCASLLPAGIRLRLAVCGRRRDDDRPRAAVPAPGGASRRGRSAGHEPDVPAGGPGQHRRGGRGGSRGRQRPTCTAPPRSAGCCSAPTSARSRHTS